MACPALLEPGFVQQPVDGGSLQGFVVFCIVEGSEAVFITRAGVRAAFDQRGNRRRHGSEARHHMKRRCASFRRRARRTGKRARRRSQAHRKAGSRQARLEARARRFRSWRQCIWPMVLLPQGPSNATIAAKCTAQRARRRVRHGVQGAPSRPKALPTSPPLYYLYYRRGAASNASRPPANDPSRRRTGPVPAAVLTVSASLSAGAADGAPGAV